MATVPLKFKKLKTVVRPVLKLTPGVEYYIKIAGPLHLGRSVADDKEPATLCNIVDLNTGEEMQIVAPKLLREALTENYEKETYIGKCFAIELMRVPDKRYNLLKTFIEIEAEETPKSAAKK